MRNTRHSCALLVYARSTRYGRQNGIAYQRLKPSAMSFNSRAPSDVGRGFRMTANVSLGLTTCARRQFRLVAQALRVTANDFQHAWAPAYSGRIAAYAIPTSTLSQRDCPSSDTTHTIRRRTPSPLVVPFYEPIAPHSISIISKPEAGCCMDRPHHPFGHLASRPNRCEGDSTYLQIYYNAALDFRALICSYIS